MLCNVCTLHYGLSVRRNYSWRQIAILHVNVITTTNLPSPVERSSIIFTQMPIKGNVAVTAQLASARAATAVWKV